MPINGHRFADYIELSVDVICESVALNTADKLVGIYGKDSPKDNLSPILADHFNHIKISQKGSSVFIGLRWLKPSACPASPYLIYISFAILIKLVISILSGNLT